MSNGRYILEDHVPVECEDLRTWGKWMQDSERQVAVTTTNDHLVSTIFLGLDHQFDKKGPPILFETMIFCHHEPECPLDQTMIRYSDWTEASEGHELMVKQVHGYTTRTTKSD